MAMIKGIKKPAQKPVDPMARMIATILKKLEASEGGRIRPEQLLNEEELEESKLMMKCAVSYYYHYIAEQADRGKKPRKPSSFIWYGQRHPLLYGGFGQMFISNKGGALLISSACDVT